MFIYKQLQRPVKNQIFRRFVKLLLDGQIGVWAWVICFYAFSSGPFFSSDALIWFALTIFNSAIFGLTRQHYRMAGMGDILRILFAGVHLFGISALIFTFSSGRILTGSYLHLFLASMSTAGVWAVLRIVLRAFSEGYFPLPKDLLHHYQVGTKTLIVGAGHAGLLVAEELVRHPELRSVVVGFVDDAFEKQGLRVQGFPVLGTTELIPTIVEQHEIEKVILAIPSAPGQLVRTIRNQLRSTNVEFKTVPGMYNLLGHQAWTPELRDVSIEDLLRRDPVRLDQSGLSRVLKDATVLITGGGGSIGSEIARQVAVFAPRQIVLLGRGENSLWGAERELRNRFPELPLAIELCDIRNVTRLRHAFHRWQPQVVFHAAAHKHVPFLEQHPEEAIENNIFGTKNVVEAALKIGTRYFVNISTDKSVNPTNVLGVSKHLAEDIVREGASRAPLGSLYVSVRFGNVLGSRGSVIPIFKEQIQRGGPVTVTDPKMTRYFMTIPEASQLVLQAGVLGKTGKVYVLDMGDPVAIVNLAKDMISLSGFVPDQDIEIEYTGIRPGEKLFEELFNAREIQITQIHDKVFEAGTDFVHSFELEVGLNALRRSMSHSEESRRREILHWFMALVPTYSPSLSGLGRYASSVKGVETGAA